MTHGTFHSYIAHARTHKQPLLAFNVVDLASLLGIAHAARVRASAFVAQYSARTVAFYGADLVVAATRAIATEQGVAVFVHLDHCRDEKILEAAVTAGFDGVMADGSHLALPENVSWTSEWRRRTSERGIVLEAEFSAIRGEEDGIAGSDGVGEPLRIDEYDRFCAATQPDICGADIGTHHGHYTQVPALDFALIEELGRAPRPPFVIHGGSGLDAATLRRLAAAGVAKVNISTDLKDAWSQGVRASSSNPEPLSVIREATNRVTQMAGQKMDAIATEDRK